MKQYIDISSNAFQILLEGSNFKATWDDTEYSLILGNINVSNNDTSAMVYLDAETGDLPFTIEASADRSSADDPWGNAAIAIDCSEEGTHTFSLLADCSACNFPSSGGEIAQ